jgi:hypothetical protein
MKALRALLSGNRSAHAVSTVSEIRRGRFDFIDFGSGDGESLRLYEQSSGMRGVGIELSETKVARARERGLAVVEGDIFELPARPLVRFVTADNMLEHMPSFDAVEKALSVAHGVVRDFVYIRHPSFEDEDYLASLGLRQYWCNWGGHRSHVRIADFADMFERVGFVSWTHQPVGLIVDSSDPSILPASAPINQHDYDATRHGAKPNAVFDRPVHYAFDIVAYKRSGARVHLDYKADPQVDRRKPRLRVG